MPASIYILYLLLGCVTGCFSGLLGVGGGLLVVPVLSVIFQKSSLMAPYQMHLAISTSLAVMLVTSTSATLFHSKKRAVDWRSFKWLALGILLGAICGSFISDQLNNRTLEIIFGCVEILIAIALLLKKFYRNQESEKNASPSIALLLLGGFVAATLGSLLGIGGGLILVPFLIFLGTHVRHAVATSLAATIVTALIATVSHLFLASPHALPYTYGFIYLPAALIIGAGTVLGAPIGVALAHKLPQHYLKIILIFVLLGFGTKMLI